MEKSPMSPVSVVVFNILSKGPGDLKKVTLSLMGRRGLRVVGLASCDRVVEGL
jgi:hypothetical protein